MRIISQNGAIDIPYDYFSLTIATGKYEDVEVACIYCHNLSSPKGTKLAEYSSKEKAEKAMEMLHRAYTGMPVVFQNVELGDDVKKMFADFRKNGIILHSFEDTESKVEHIDNVIFQFPQDEDVEV